MNGARRLLAPEVVQTSAMDCGPAALKCLLEGHGIAVSYGRLREACQTEVDGTSIDTLEAVARELGLEACQVMAPEDHLLLPEAALLPALVVVRQAGGMTHFVVAWRRHGPFVQIMDPALGRRWLSVERFEADLYRHAMPVAADTWRAWAASDGLGDPLRARLRALGLGDAGRRSLLDAAEGDPGWRTYAALDAATRLVATLVASGGLRRGAQARRLLQVTLRRLAAGTAPEDLLPEELWGAGPAPEAPDGTPRVEMRGAVLVRVSGRRTDRGRGDLPPELQAALAETPLRPGRHLWRLLRADGLFAPAALTAALALAAAAVVVEALLFRGLLELTGTLGSRLQRWSAMGLLAAFLIALLGLQGTISAGWLRLGRRLEVRLRRAFLTEIPSLGDRYFRSRPISDMAERSHTLHHVRRLPALAGGFLRTAFVLLLTAAGIVWIEPSAAPVATLAAAFALGWPLLGQRALVEGDLRLQTHAGAMSRFFLDALLGLTAIRTHGAEGAVRRAHDGLLVAWWRAGLRLQRMVVGVEGVQAGAGFILAAWILYDHLGNGPSGASLLLVYWALHLPVLGQELASYVRQYPMMRNKTLRLLEPLGGRSHRGRCEALPVAARDATPAVGAPRHPGVEVELAGVSVRAGGHTLLEGIDLQVPAGQHIAVVGPSGAGKSSLVGLLLGWHVPAAGTLRVDGAPLDRRHLEALRRRTARVDPSVELWNSALLENLTYARQGRRHEGPRTLSDVLVQADLRGVLQGLSEGLQTPLGEGGGRLSGGEGQRVRFGRALLQGAPRLVILDEPFRGLDLGRRRALHARARERWRPATLFSITHDVADTGDFDRVLVVDSGRIVEDGPPARLLRRPSRYRALMEGDAAARQVLSTGGPWRRLHLADGLLEEVPDAAPTLAPPPTLDRHRRAPDGSALRLAHRPAR